METDEILYLDYDDTCVFYDYDMNNISTYNEETYDTRNIRH